MTRIGRRPLVITVVVLSCAIIGYQLVPRDETRINARLDELCARLTQARDPSSLESLRQFLAQASLPSLGVRVVELGLDAQGVEEASEYAKRLLEGPPLTFALNSVEIKISDRLARVEAELLVSVRGGGEQRREVRRTRVRLAKHTDAWQFEAVEVEPIAPSEPEARP